MAVWCLPLAFPKPGVGLRFGCCCFFIYYSSSILIFLGTDRVLPFLESIYFPAESLQDSATAHYPICFVIYIPPIHISYRSLMLRRTLISFSIYYSPLFILSQSPQRETLRRLKSISPNPYQLSFTYASTYTHILFLFYYSPLFILSQSPQRETLRRLKLLICGTSYKLAPAGVTYLSTTNYF